MRMKAVCEATGLTDRTVRYYIEEGLIAPDYTENYLGRKTFDFCEADIRRLKDIAVLRKFGFTVAEIRDMLHAPEKIDLTVTALRERKRLQIEGEQALLLVLERLTAHCETVAELAAILSTPPQAAQVPLIEERFPITGLFRSFLAAVLRAIAAWTPILISVWLMVFKWGGYEYPNFRPRFFALLMVSLVPAALILNWHRLRERFNLKPKLGGFLWALCVLSVPFCAVFALNSFSHSETTDIGHYRVFDGRCIVNQSAFFDEFFPPNAQDDRIRKDANGELRLFSLDAVYYYRYLDFVDYTYDVCAEWPMSPEDFEAEVSRVSALFTNEAHIPQDHDYAQLQKGPWTCLVLYGRGQEPFVEVTDSYSYWIFAFDPDTQRVRYIRCDSLENGADRPYYLELDWE